MSNSGMRLGQGYFALIGHFEKGPNGGPALTSYLCPAGVPTIGLGSIKRLDGSPVELGDTVTMDEVFLLAERDAENAADAVRKIQRPLTQNQFEAYTAFAHNLGEGNFRKIAPLIEEGRWEDVAEKMGEYVRAWGKYEGRWYFMALLGLKIRRTAEALHSLGLQWQDVCDPDNIGMPKRREWQPDGIAKDGSKGRYYDVLLPGATEFTALEAIATKLPASELVLTHKADPAAVPVDGKAGQPGPVAQPQVPAAPAPKPIQPGATSSPASGPVAAPKAPQAPTPLPVPLPKRPDPPIPIGQQTSAVDAARKSEEWSSNTKAMWQSRRFYGLVLIMAGRLWMLKTGSNAFLGAVSDPLVMEFVGGFCVMVAGELVQTWGRQKATRALH